MKIFLLVGLLLLFGCSNEKESSNFFNEKLTCPSPAMDEFQPWGKSGTQHICKIKHGPFIAWENGYVHVRGQYDNGKETGVWYWYDKNGSVINKIDYAKP
jgi:antitoxin component YwqK of YwqJK toxin-antitoxin module